MALSAAYPHPTNKIEYSYAIMSNHLDIEILKLMQIKHHFAMYSTGNDASALSKY